MIKSLLYVSRSNLPRAEAAAEVDAIVAVARSRNAPLGVTGALIFTERHFAQNLEGPEAAVAELMNSILSDDRHSQVDIVYDEAIPERRFPIWAMAYAGPSTFVAGNVSPLADPGEARFKRKAAERVIMLMRQFVEADLAAERRNQRPS